MKQRGIVFSAPLVLVLLRGEKTVTRRLDRSWLKLKVGDLLYVRESIRRDGEPEGDERWCPSVFVADGAPTKADCWPWQRKLLPSIHMPAGLSRIHLRVTEPPRLERVQDITEDEAKREGMTLPAPDLPQCPCESDVDDPGSTHLPHCLWRQPHVDPHESGPYVAAFVCTWTELHDKPGQRWEENPEIVRIAFEREAA